MLLPTGARLGDFEIVGFLGAGGMGQVYRARDLALGRDVALKVLPAEAEIGEPFDRFSREARALAAINHPHIVVIHSIHDVDGVRFFTMELVRGAPLAQAIVPGGLPLPRLFDLAVPLADALASAHEHGIVHRDLKPANVMVDDAGRVKVLDFGLAKRAAPAAGAAITRIATAPGVVLGTVPYMAPEQVEGRDTDGRADVFTLGVVLYEMTGGVRPFDADSQAGIMSAILRDDPRPLSHYRRDVPPALDRLIRRCLAKAPDDRYQTMREVERELRALRREAAAISRSRRTAADENRPAFWTAVQPFKVTPADSALQAFAEGLAEDVAGGLDRFPYLTVVAHESAQEARYLLEASVRQAGPALRVHVQLTDAGRGTRMWAETFNRTVEGADMFSLQDDLTDRVVASIADVHGVLVRSMAAELREESPAGLSPGELLLRFWASYQNPRAEEHALLRDAVEGLVQRIPHDAEVWAMLANLYSHEYSHFFNPRPDPLVRALAAAQRSLELNRATQHGWMALAVAQFFSRDRASFLSSAERALAQNPRDTNTMAWLALLIGHAGETDRGFALIQRARALNPQHPGWYHCVEFDHYYLSGDYETAYRVIKQVNMPELLFPHLLLVDVCGQLGLVDEARDALAGLRAVEPGFALPDVHGEVNRRWFMRDELAEPFHEGFLKALALVGA